MSKHLRLSVLVVGLALAGTGAAVAQNANSTAAPGTTTAGNANTAPRNDDRGFDWGWLGLIGLAGLAGLNRRDRAAPTMSGSTVNSRT